MIRLDDDEVQALLDEQRVGVCTSLRRDTTPITLPVWYAPIRRRVYLRNPPQSKKRTRVRNDPRVAFLCEAGERWVTFVDAESEISRFATVGTWCVVHRQVGPWLAGRFDLTAAAQPQDDRSPWALGVEEMQPRILRSAAQFNFQLARIAAPYRLTVKEG